MSLFIGFRLVVSKDYDEFCRAAEVPIVHRSGQILNHFSSRHMIRIRPIVFTRIVADEASVLKVAFINSSAADAWR